MTVSIAALITVNLIPLIGVLFNDWDAGLILLLYWSENLVLGGYNALKILLRPAEHPIVFAGRLLPAAFFCFHYGAFCGVHGLFLLSFIDPSGPDVMSSNDWPFLLVFMEILVETIKAVWLTRFDVLFWPLLALVVSHGISFIQNYLRGGEFRTATTEQLMHQPYSRIVLLHVVIIAGGFAVLTLGSPVPVLVLLVIGKIGLDISLHIREHRPNR